MVVHKLSLRNFRNYQALDVTLDPGINIFYGDNAQGKTNLLESIYFCATGHSQRTNQDRELIKFTEEEAHIRLFTKSKSNHQQYVSPDYYTDKIDIHLKKSASKGIAVNGVPIQKLGQLFGVLLAVIFSPEDLQLVKAGPAERRRFMDMELCQISPAYCYDLQQYYHVLKQRNNLLRAIKSNKMTEDTLFVWDEQLVLHGVKIIKHRRAFIELVSSSANAVHGQITHETESLQVLYRPNVTEDDFLEKLNKNVERDVLAGTTGVGIHKDDLSFTINSMDVRIYGSQGQQRTVSLSAKLAEVDIMKAQRQRTPVLLLDDVLSELDESRQTFLMKSIADIQSVITCTGLENIINKVSAQYTLYKVENGKIH